jgi:hypothetical protein
VYAKLLGSLALVPSLILQHCEDKSLLKLSHRFRASRAGFVHLQDDTCQLFLHFDFSSYGPSALEDGNLLLTARSGGNREREKHLQNEKAVTLVMP